LVDILCKCINYKIEYPFVANITLDPLFAITVLLHFIFQVNLFAIETILLLFEGFKTWSAEGLELIVDFEFLEI